MAALLGALRAVLEGLRLPLGPLSCFTIQSSFSTESCWRVLENRERVEIASLEKKINYTHLATHLYTRKARVNFFSSTSSRSNAGGRGKSGLGRGQD